MKAADREHLYRVRCLGCVICRRPAEVHHVRRGGEKRDHRKTIALCARHHRNGGHGVAIHAGRETWEERYGAELDYLDMVQADLVE